MLQGNILDPPLWANIRQRPMGRQSTDRGIVIAANENKSTIRVRRPKRFERVADLRRKRIFGMKQIAEKHNLTRTGLVDHLCKQTDRRVGRSVGHRDRGAAKRGVFAKMGIGDEQRFFGRPENASAGNEVHVMTAQSDRLPTDVGGAVGITHRTNPGLTTSRSEDATGRVDRFLRRGFVFTMIFDRSEIVQVIRWWLVV